MQSIFNIGGNLDFQQIPTYQRDLRLDNIFRGLFPHDNISKEVAQWRRKNLRFAFPGFLRYLRSRLMANPHFVGALSFSLIDPVGKETDFGLVSLDMITDVGAAYVVSSFLATAVLSNLRFHGLGSSSASLAVANTTLAAELSTSYSTANTRITGTAAVGDSTKIFVTIGINTFSGTVSCAEWGLFNQASTLTGSPAGGTLFDRSTFATQNVLATFSAKTTYTLTVASGT